MQILTEIIDSSHELHMALKTDGFFETHQFINEDEFLKGVQIEMQRKWEQSGDMELSDEELVDFCNSLIKNAISDSLFTLVGRGEVKMSIDNDGEFVYQLNNNKDAKY